MTPVCLSLICFLTRETLKGLTLPGFVFGVCACTFVLICVGIDCVDLTKVSIYYGRSF